jgi:ERCC4-type nuclease
VDSTNDLTVITGETPTDTRESLYASGGVIGVTARVLLSDLLSLRLSPELVDLLVINRAHSLSDDSNEVFAVRLFREKNPRGSLVLTSEKPTVFSPQSIGQIVKNFYLSEVLFFPRFHELVMRGLDSTSTPATIQIACNRAIRMVEMQNLLCNIMEDCLIEIRKSRESTITAAELLSNKTSVFAFRRSLESVWLKLSWRARQIVGDLTVIRQLVLSLERYCCVTFLTLLEAQEKISSKQSPWWFCEHAQRLMVLAKERVRDYEIPEKWQQIETFLMDFVEKRMDSKRARSDAGNDIKILVAVSDDVARDEYALFVSEGTRRALSELAQRKRCIIPSDDSVGFALEGVHGRDTRLCFEISANLNKPDGLVGDISRFRPEIVIFVEPSLSGVRVLEVMTGESSIKSVLILELEGGISELKFATLIQRENAAFDECIRSKPMVTFYSKDELFCKRKILTAAGSSRKAGGRKTVGELLHQTVLVDTRELRSALPFALYKADLNLVPSTLSIGDYILSRDIAVERKSVTGNDLQQSLYSGRLYKQLVNMSNSFAWPVLLLEFSTGKSFQLQSAEIASTGEINPGSLIAQIVALIIHFPTLRIMWSPSFQFTANMFVKLKQGREQPRLEPETKMTAQSSMAGRAIEFLKTLPGITAANLPAVMKRVASVRELVQLGEAELVALLGKREAYLLSTFLNFNVD